ncbi:sodium/calcium exchanger 2-like isoform X2 [Babylonia areolata]|uniref:sodium/calcium exchanger 2-like isoform X2 n=1 Tax=Babylonia areolata TaxID=304850 RepID=UPI003FCFF05F
MSTEFRTNYSHGYVVEYLDSGEERCSSWLLIPAENLWPEAFRGFLYILALAYFFMGIAIASDVFMCSIEVITSKKRKVVRWDEERQEKVEREVLLWNETVANLTLMALGSSAPEILLATGEMVGDIDERGAKDALGTFTIIGSAAFNLLIITAVCVLSVPTGQVKSIKELGVFIVTSIWSIWAYVWMLLVVRYITPGEIDPWEAWLTLAFLPLFVIIAYFTDRGWCCSGKKKIEGVDNEDDADDVAVRVVGHQHQHFTRTVPKELRVLEAQKAHRMSDKLQEDSTQQSPRSRERLARNKSAKGEPQAFARARFRHAAVSALMGSSNFNRHPDRKSQRMAEVVNKVKSINDAIKQGKAPDGDLMGKFTFASDRYAVLESAGTLDIDVLFHRQILSLSVMKNMNANHSTKNGQATTPISPSGVSLAAPDPSAITSVVSIDYETREGSAKPGKDFKYTQGTLTFNENEYKKSITIPIINDNQYEADVDFYIILKNPTGGAGLGDPSISRITIVDDDEPGEFLFEESHYHADMKSGKITVKVVREQGIDGKVSLEYSTINGTAVGGKTVGTAVDYVEAHGTLTFEHAETTKTITVDFNKNAQGPKNFIIALRNPSIGAKIGIRSAVVVHLNKDELMERVGEVLDEEEEEEITWGGQFVQAMTVEPEKDEDGNEINPKWNHYLMHFLTFFWKVFCALIPPTSIWGAWPSFVISLIFIGIMTTIVEQLGKLLGCVVGLETSVTGITIIALGTSLPDTFASRTAALQDEHADAAIGNVTGSNSVNVFLGLGLPWVLKTMHALVHGYTFKVKTDNLTQSVVIFATVGTICIILLLIRRKVMGGELGGKTLSGKLLTSGFLVVLWLIYIILSSLKAYDKIDL